MVASLCCWMILWWRLRCRRRRVLTVVAVVASLALMVVLSTEALVLMVSTEASVLLLTEALVLMVSTEALVLLASLGAVWAFRIQEVYAGATVALLVHVRTLPRPGATGTAAPVSDTAAPFSDTGVLGLRSVAVSIVPTHSLFSAQQAAPLDPLYPPTLQLAGSHCDHCTICGMSPTATILTDHHSTLL